MSALTRAQDISVLALRAAASGMPPAGIFFEPEKSKPGLLSFGHAD
jgi:hypothetical protein